jgi:Tol biopolymer transport system component
VPRAPKKRWSKETTEREETLSISYEGKAVLITKLATQEIGTNGKTRQALLAGLALGAARTGMVALAGTAPQAQAAFPDKIVFVSNLTTGKGVDNPTGDREVFTINPNGTGLKQLTFNETVEYLPTLSPDGRKIAYVSSGVQPSNPEGDTEVYVMNASDGSGNTNLTDNGAGVSEWAPDFSPDGQRVAYQTGGAQASNPEGDGEVYVISAADGSGKRNLSNTALEVNDFLPDFSPDGQKLAYGSEGVQTSNPEGDYEIYAVNAVDGSGKRNLSNTGQFLSEFSPDYSPDGRKIAYTSEGVQELNPEGDSEIFVMNAADGSGQKNLSNNSTIGNYVYDDQPDFSPDGKKVVFRSEGSQASNPEGDQEVYAISALDGTGQRNLSNNSADTVDGYPDFSSDGKKVAYTTRFAQPSNPEGDQEVYTVNVADGSGQKNLTNNDVNDDSPKWGGG